MFSPSCISDSDKITSDPPNKRRLGEKRQVSSKKKIRDKKQKNPGRYMKSSCRWTTIHFHFEVLRTIVKCDCIWQSPRLPVYHDGYTLPPRRCCSTRVHARARACALINTWTWRHRNALLKAARQKQTVTLQVHGAAAAAALKDIKQQ